jgi:hypothetical protein
VSAKRNEAFVSSRRRWAQLGKNPVQEIGSQQKGPGGSTHSHQKLSIDRWQLDVEAALQMADLVLTAPLDRRFIGQSGINQPSRRAIDGVLVRSGHPWCSAADLLQLTQ